MRAVKPSASKRPDHRGDFFFRQVRRFRRPVKCPNFSPKRGASYCYMVVLSCTKMPIELLNNLGIHSVAGISLSLG